MPNFRLTLLLSLLLAPLGVRCGAPTMWLQPLVDIDPLAVRRCAGVDAAPLTLRRSSFATTTPARATTSCPPPRSLTYTWYIWKVSAHVPCLAAARADSRQAACGVPQPRSQPRGAASAPTRRCYDQFSCDYRFKARGWLAAFQQS